MEAREADGWIRVKFIAAFAFLLPVTVAHGRGPEGWTTLSNASIRYTVPEQPYVVLRRGPIEAVIVDNRAVNDDVLVDHRAGYNGLALLRHRKQPRNIFVPRYAGLNFEHIYDGTLQNYDVLFEPRRAPMQLRRINKYTAELCQAPTPHWQLESCTRYTLLRGGTIELRFEAIPRAATFANGYIGLFWASYIEQPESLDIHFIGPDGWIRGITPRHGKNAVHRALGDDRLFGHDAAFAARLTLPFGFSDHRHAEPWYFGVSHGMALAYVFRAQDGIRLTQSPRGAGDGNPAWDFQWFIEHPEPGKVYRMAMRAVYAPYKTHDDVRASLKSHRKAIDRY